MQKDISLLDESKETVEDSVFDNIEPLHSDEKWNMQMMKEAPLAPPVGQREDIVMSLIDSGDTSDLRNKCEQEETSLLSIQPPPPLSAENLSFNVENMSSFFASENKSLWSSTFEREDTSSIWNIPLENVSKSLSSGKQQWHSIVESPQPPSLPLSAENLSFNVENIIMSSFFDCDTRSSSCNMFEWEEACNSISTIQLESKSNIVSVADNIIATSENAYQKLDDENKSPRPCSASLRGENSSDVEDNIMIAFAGGKCESSSRNEFDQKEISINMTIPLGYELSHVVVVDDEKPISYNEHQQFDYENRLIAEKKVCLNVGNDVETKYLPVHEVESSSTQPLLALQSKTVTEKDELKDKEEHKLLPLKDNHSSISIEKRIQEMVMLNKKQVEVGKDYVDKVNEDSYQIIGHLLDCQSQYKNDSSMKTTSGVTPNLPINENIECCVEEKYNATETLESSKSVLEKDYEHKELSKPNFVPCAREFLYSSLLNEEVSPKIAVNKESQTPYENVNVTSLVRSQSNSEITTGSIWLRRGKPAGFPRIETSVSRANRVGTSLMDEVDHEIVGDETVANNTLLCHLAGEEEEEIFTPDKENFTPNTLLMNSLKKKTNNLEDSGNFIRSSKSQTSIFKSRHKVKQEEEQSEDSDKENQTPKVLQEQKLAKQISKNRRFGKEKLVIKRGGAEGTPFQSLQSNLAEKKRLDAIVAKPAKKSNTSVSTGAMKVSLSTIYHMFSNDSINNI